jgi:plastocyanin
MNKRILGAAVGAAVLAFSMVSTGVALAAPTAQTITIDAGGGENGVSANDFFPDSVTIHFGDTIHFVNPFAEIHTVSFVPAGHTAPDFIIPGPSGPPQFLLNPEAVNPTSPASPASFDSSKYFNVGLLQKDQTADVIFKSAGTFKAICLVHGSGMELTVNVVAATAPADSQSTVDARATAERNALLQKGEQLAQQTTLTSEALPDGSTNWHVTVGGMVDEADLSQFLPSAINIQVGDTVTWTNSTPTPHTVTFLGGSAEPQLFNPQPQSAGAPLLYLNPQAVIPAGGNVYNGTGYLNSGFIGQGFPTQTFSVKFTQAGSFAYLCLLHGDEGMKGTVNVAAGPSAPSPQVVRALPNTGTGGQQAGASEGWPVVIAMGLGIAGVLLLAGGLGALRIARRAR